MSDRKNQVGPLTILFVLAATAVCGFNMTVSQPDRHPVILALSLAWLIHSFSLLLLGEAFLKLDPKQFRLASWERDGGVYEWVGVRTFRWILICTRWNLINRDIRLKSGRTDLNRLLRYLNLAEGTHTISGGITLIAAIGYALTGHAITGIWLAGVNVLVNIYPVMLQRWNRGRIFQVQRRLAKRDITNSNFHSESTSQHFEPQTKAQPDDAATGN